MDIDEIISVLSDSNLLEKNKIDLVYTNLHKYCLQPDHILDCYRALKRLKSELTELSKDADHDRKKIVSKALTMVKTEIKIIEYQIDNPNLMVRNEMSKLNKMHWTASTSGLVEIIYLMKNCVDNGNVEVKEIADWFEYIFQVKLDNIYKIIEQISNRKKNKTKFLDEEKLNLLKFLEDFSLRKSDSYKK